MKRVKNYFILSLIFGTLLGSIFYIQKLSIEPTKFAPSMVGFERSTMMGFENFAASYYWLTFIQDGFLCSGLKNRIAKEQKHLLERKTCSDRWGYVVLKAISHLNPKIKSLYVWGVTTLSVFETDPEGASELFEKGMDEFPDSWLLQYRAGYHEVIERKRPELGAKYYRLAEKNGGPDWLATAAASLLSEAGQKIEAKRLLIDLLKTAPSEQYKKTVLRKIQSLDE